MIGFELGFSVVAGMLLGHYVDRWAENDTPWFTMLGVLAGGFAGFNLLLRMIKRIDNGKDGQSD